MAIWFLKLAKETKMVSIFMIIWKDINILIQNLIYLNTVVKVKKAVPKRQRLDERFVDGLNFRTIKNPLCRLFWRNCLRRAKKHEKKGSWKKIHSCRIFWISVNSVIRLPQIHYTDNVEQEHLHFMRKTLPHLLLQRVVR